jgi:hypothetical protein
MSKVDFMEKTVKEQIVVELPRTGDPWIDSGIVSFADMFAAGRRIPNLGGKPALEQIDVQWQGKDTISISGKNQKFIEDFLKTLFDHVKSIQYIENTSNKVCVFNEKKDDFEVVPKVNLVGVVGFLFGGGDLKAKYRKIPLTNRLRKKLNKTKGLYQKQKNVTFNVDENNRTYSSHPHFNWPYKPNLEGKSARCSFCRRSVPCSHLHANNYPFAVATEHFMNFFSNLQFEPGICSLCELASLFAINRVFFNLSEGRSRLFLAIPHAQSLDELDRFWQEMKPILPPEPLKKTSNILDEGYRYRRLDESILAFCLELYLKLRKVKESDRRLKEASTKTWHFYFARREGKTVFFEGYAHLTSLHRLFALFSTLPAEEFKQTFQNLTIRQGEQWRTELRNQMAHRIIKNADLNDLAERIMWEKGYVRNLTNFVEQYSIWRG